MKSILFDFGGTLDSDGRTWGDRFFPIYKETGVDRPRPEFDRAFYASDDHLQERFALRGLSLEDTVVLQVRCVLERLAPERLELAETVADRFLAESRAAFRRNRPVLERLAAKHRLGIVSNFYGNLDGILRSEGLDDLFGAVADSGVVGISKPEAGIFRHAASALGVEPSDCLMVGDSIPRDMRGAEGLGMAHALLHPGEAGCCAAALRLKTLPQLETILS